MRRELLARQRYHRDGGHPTTTRPRRRRRGDDAARWQPARAQRAAAPAVVSALGARHGYGGADRRRTVRGGGPAARRVGEAWTLQPWSEDDAMRGVFPLDEVWVAGLERSESAIAGRGCDGGCCRWCRCSGRCRHRCSRSWERQWGFPAAMATMLSALGELALATVGVVHVLATAVSGTGMAAGPLTWLGLASPLLLVESFVRLKHVSATQEPIGSALSLPLSLLAPPGPLSRRRLCARGPQLRSRRGLARAAVRNPPRRLDGGRSAVVPGRALPAGVGGPRRPRLDLQLRPSGRGH